MEPPRKYRPTCVAFALIGLCAAPVAVSVAQTPPSAEQYQDLLNQLKAAQDRKNELATENAKLRQEIADQSKKVTSQAERLAGSESRAYFLRQHYATWQQFLEQYPAVRSMWTAYFASTDTTDVATELLGDGRWPFGVEE